MVSILIMCATGIATSTVMTSKVNAWLKENNYDKQVKMYQSKIGDEMGKLKNYDIVISSTFIQKNERDDIINGIPFLTGMGVDKVFEELKEQLDAHIAKKNA